MVQRVSRAQAAAGPLADYAVGQHVDTREGFTGTITDIHEGPADLTTYWVTLDDGMGGGEYAEAEIWPVEATTAAGPTSAGQATAEVVEAAQGHTADVDYPALAQILRERLPPTTASADTSMNGQGEGPPFAQAAQRAADYSGTEVSGTCTVCGKALVLKRGSLTHADGSNEHAASPSADSDAPLGVTSDLTLPLQPEPGSRIKDKHPGYQEGHEHGAEGLTRKPSKPEDPEFRSEYDQGWSDGVETGRQTPDTLSLDHDPFAYVVSPPEPLKDAIGARTVATPSKPVKMGREALDDPGPCQHCGGTIFYSVDRSKGSRYVHDDTFNATCPSRTTASARQSIIDSWVPTSDLVRLCLNAHTWDQQKPVWKLVDATPEGAREFFESLEEFERRSNAAEVLETAGWDLSKVNHKVSSLAAKADDNPTVSGVALLATDTGRVLMLQRGVQDKSDPAAGCWEFPGGHHEDGDTTSLHAGIREWEEEVGRPFPEGGYVAHTWRSPDGVYQGHVVVIAEESEVALHEGRSKDNPDDPDGDKSEQVAWWDPADAKKNPALRTECKKTPWDKMTVPVAKAAGRQNDPSRTTRYQLLIQHSGQPLFRSSHYSAEALRAKADLAYGAGASQVQIIRKSDGEIVHDPHAEIELDDDEWKREGAVHVSLLTSKEAAQGQAVYEDTMRALAGPLWDLVRGQESDDPDQQIGTSYSFDWCRFRQKSHCWLPKTFDNDKALRSGSPQWIPEDRGYCPRPKWDAQRACPVGEPGPNAKRGSLEGLSEAAADPEFRNHVTARWSDIRTKAKQIRSEGGVRMVADADGTIVAHVKGDSNVYETSITRAPGSRSNVAFWACGCAWSAYSWGRSGPWKRYEGRMCSHALALQYEAQSRGMFGKTIQLDQQTPSWQDPTIPVRVPGEFDRDKQKYSSLEVVADAAAEAKANEWLKRNHLNFKALTEKVEWSLPEPGVIVGRRVDKGSIAVLLDRYPIEGELVSGMLSPSDDPYDKGVQGRLSKDGSGAVVPGYNGWLPSGPGEPMKQNYGQGKRDQKIQDRAYSVARKYFRKFKKAGARRPVEPQPDNDQTPLHLVASVMIASGYRYTDVRDLVSPMGVTVSSLVKQARATDFFGKVRGLIKKLFLDDGGLRDEDGQKIPPREVLYPGWDPHLGLNPNDRKRASRTATKEDQMSADEWDFGAPALSRPVTAATEDEWGMELLPGEPSYDRDTWAMAGPNTPVDSALDTEMVDGFGDVAELHDEPEPALPVTDGEQQQAAAALLAALATSDEARDWDLPREPGEELLDPPYDEDKPTKQSSLSAEALLANHDERLRLIAAGDPTDHLGPDPYAHLQTSQSAGEDMKAAQQWLATEGAREGIQATALKDYSASERQAIIDEGDGAEPSNFDRMDVSGTHYEAVAAAEAAEAEISDMGWMG